VSLPSVIARTPLALLLLLFFDVLIGFVALISLTVEVCDYIKRWF